METGHAPSRLRRTGATRRASSGRPPCRRDRRQPGRPARGAHALGPLRRGAAARPRYAARGQPESQGHPAHAARARLAGARAAGDGGAVPRHHRRMGRAGRAPRRPAAGGDVLRRPAPFCPGPRRRAGRGGESCGHRSRGAPPCARAARCACVHRRRCVRAGAGAGRAPCERRAGARTRRGRQVVAGRCRPRRGCQRPAAKCRLAHTHAPRACRNGWPRWAWRPRWKSA